MEKNGKKQHWYRITFMADYPYSSSMDIKAYNEEDAWKEFEIEHGSPRDNYCSIELL